MRLNIIQDALRGLNIPFQYTENDDCGGIEFNHRGLSYHVWEYPEPERGAASNVQNAGRMKDYEDHYEEEIAAILKRDFR